MESPLLLLRYRHRGRAQIAAEYFHQPNLNLRQEAAAEEEGSA